MDKKSFSIRSAAAHLEVSEMYLRKMIHQGKIQTSHVQVTENVWRHEITEAELAKFKARTSVRTSREDGRNKYVAYMTPVEFASVTKLLKDGGFEKVAALIERANPSK